MTAMRSSRYFFKIFIFLVLFVFVIFTLVTLVKRWDTDELPTTHPQVEGCQDVLKTMLQGTWVGIPHTKYELTTVERFLRLSRQEHSLPRSLQRSDGICGNVTFDELVASMNKLMWFRALCDPEGSVPCCYHNVCVSRTSEQCQCQHCYDMRQPIHAELATWVPRDPGCKIRTFDTAKGACKLLHNMTVYMLGDSLVRHVYISLLTLLRRGDNQGPLKRTANLDIKAECDADFIHLKMCMFWIDGDTQACGNTVRLKFLENALVSHSQATLTVVNDLIGRPNSLLFIGIGIHNDYNASLVANELLSPLLKHLSTSPWPKLVWATAHAPGILKTPRIPSQSRDSVLAYNAELRPILDAQRVPVFDTFQLTDGVMSFDGVHYGRGVNDVKAQILLNYLLQLRSNGEMR